MRHPARARFDDLLERVRAGDQHALGVLLDELRPKLLPVVRAMMGRAIRGYADPEDVFQDAVLAAMGSLARLEADSLAGFRSWFLGIARNRVHVLRERRRDKTNPRRTTPVPASRLAYQDPVELEGFTSEATPRDTNVAPLNPLSDKLDGLKAEHRLALVLREYFAVSWKTLAFVLDNPSEMAVRQIHRRARRQMAGKLR